MNPNLELLKKNNLIINIEEIQFTDDELNGLKDKEIESIKERRDKINVYKITYKVRDKKITGYIIEPKLGENLPAIIWNRGGSKEFGEIEKEHLFGANPTMAPLAIEGYILFASQYPGIDGGEGVDEMGSDLDVECVTNLYDVLKNYPRVNSEKVGMFGHSRGGAMVYRALAKVDWIKAAVIGSAPTNEIRAGEWRKGWKEHQIEMFGGSLEECKKRSAIFWVDKFSKKTPLLIMHGTSDWRVNPQDSIDMAEELTKNNIVHKLIMFEGADHGITQFKRKYRKEAIDWFNKYLKQ